MMYKLFKNNIRKEFWWKAVINNFFRFFSEALLSAPKRLKRLLDRAQDYKGITALSVVLAGISEL